MLIFAAVKTMPMVLRLLKNAIINLYKGLIYWFFWAGFVTLRDEMFCTVARSSNAQSRYEVVDTDVAAPVKNAIAPDIRTIYFRLRTCCERHVRTLRDAFAATNEANLRALMEAAKDLPQRHRLRIALYSG